MDDRTASVQVAVRLRPMNNKEQAKDTLPVVTANSSRNEVTLIRGSSNRQQRQTYSFDAVFGSFSEQGHVFETIRPLVQDVLEGFEATVFAYGQTGTGKTHTMEGDLRDEQGKGVIPRAVEAIFEQLKTSKYTSSHVMASYLEIYNEELSDLLHVGPSGPAVTATPRPGAKPADADLPKLQLVEEAPKKKDQRGSVFVKNLSEHKVENAEDVLKLIGRAQEKRKIGETQMNKHSSRSHCVFTLSVVSSRFTMDGTTQMECTGKLHLVDLAGSECAKTAGGGESGKGQAGEARERERKNINQSLLTLGRVISTLKECTEKKMDASAVRIPYRDSKLTRLLQESLGGRCKTVIIATLSPSVLAVDETFSTLNYAQQAHGIQNKPVATSYVKSGMGMAMPKAGDGAVGEGATIQDWNEMECRLMYMQSQVEEAQSTLARKVREQEELEKRAEKAEAERAEAQAALEKEQSENERLTAECAKHEAELKVAAFMISTRAATESRLGSQAKTVLGCLHKTETEAATLHANLTTAAQEADAQAARRGAFAASLHVQLQQAQAQVSALGNALTEERAAVLEAASKAEASLAEHASAMSKHAASMASMHADEATRSGAALAKMQASATASVQAACAELADGVKNAASKAASAQGAVASQIEGVVAAVEQAQLALSEGINTAVGRQAVAEEEAAAQRKSISAAVAANASDVGGRLADEAKRFVAHSGALRVLLGEIRDAQTIEASARAAISTLIASEEADSTKNTDKMKETVDAIAAALDAQRTAQPDASLRDTLAMAGTQLSGVRDSTSAALTSQQAALAGAIEAQNAGNAVTPTTAALEAARASVDAAAAARIAEVDTAAKKIAAQKEALAAMLSEQSALRATLLEQVMSTVEATLSAQLSTLADKADVAVQNACTTSDEIAAVGASAAANTKKAAEAYGSDSAQLIGMCTAWGAANDDVASRMAAARTASASAVTGLAAGAKEVDASHVKAAGLVDAWAHADGQCRESLASVSEATSDAMAAAALATEGRVASIRDIDGTAAKLEGMSKAAAAQLTAAGTDVDAGVAKVNEAHEAGDAAAAKIGESISALGASQAAARKTEADALGVLNTAADDAATATSSTLVDAKAAGDAAVKELQSSAAAHAAGATELAKAQTGLWTSHAESEAALRQKASDGVGTQRDLAAGEANLHTNALTNAKESREQASTAASQAHAAALSTQSTGVSGMKSAVDAFTTESAAEPTAVPIRNPQPFVQGFVQTPAEGEMRAHYATSGGDVPMSPIELEPEVFPVASSLPTVSSPPPSASKRASMPTPRGSITKRASLVDGAALRTLTVPVLKGLCDEYDVSKDGNKEELIRRLTEKGAKPPAATPTRQTPRRAKSDPNVASEGGETAVAATKAEAAATKKPVALSKQSSKIGAAQSKIATGAARRSANENRKEVGAN